MRLREYFLRSIEFDEVINEIEHFNLPPKRTCIGKQDCQYRSRLSRYGSNTGGVKRLPIQNTDFLLSFRMSPLIWKSPLVNTATK